jgi:hypothetical protein
MSQFKFNFDNIAYVGYYPLGNETVSCINFGFAYNRLKNFDRNYQSFGKGMRSSLSDFIAKDASLGGYRVDELTSRQNFDPYRDSRAPWIDILGFNGRIIQPSPDAGYVSYLLDNETVDPELDVTERGTVESYDFTLGTDFSDKLYFGVTFSLTDMHYSVSSRYSEFYGTGTDGFDLTNSLVEDGSGCRVSVGAIFRPVDALRVGLAYHSPTWYNMSRSFWGKVKSEYTFSGANGGTEIEKYEASAPQADPYGVFDYRLQTPQRITASIAGVIGTKAVISLDYELTDYTAMDLSDSNGSSVYYDAGENLYINEDFKKASTVKVGAEYRLTPQFSIRAGYAWMQNPHAKQVVDGNVGIMMPSTGTIPHHTVEGDVGYITCGLGYKFTKSFYMDVAFVYRSQTDNLYYFPKYFKDGHLLVDSTPVRFENKMYKGVLTLGYKF